jgi:glycosyltransferase involved in cell wall biosynthesis
VSKRILWLTSSYPRFKDDSASIFLRNLAESLQKENFEIHVVAPDHWESDDSQNGNGIILHRFRYFFPRHSQKLAYGSGILPNLKSNPWLFFQIPFFIIALFFSTWKLILHLQPALIHAHWIFPQGTIGVLLSKLMNIPIIITAHGGDAFALSGSTLAKIKSWTIKQCCIWTSNTNATAKAVGIDLPKPKIIPMGIKYKLFNSGQSGIKSTDTFILLFVGRLVEKKGVNDLIIAYSLLSETLRNKTKLWIIGDGNERKTLEKLTNSYNLDKNVVFYGKLPNNQLPDYYAKADIFIAPSITDASGDTEGQGVILLEALASGTAVLSTKTGGINEIIRDRKNGILVEPEKPHELKSAIEELLKNKSLRHSLIAEGEKTAKNYDWKIIGQRFSALYHSYTN